MSGDCDHICQIPFPSPHLQWYHRSTLTIVTLNAWGVHRACTPEGRHPGASPRSRLPHPALLTLTSVCKTMATLKIQRPVLVAESYQILPPLKTKSHTNSTLCTTSLQMLVTSSFHDRLHRDRTDKHFVSAESYSENLQSPASPASGVQR